MLRALLSPHYKCSRWIILTIPLSMLVSCFKSSRLYPHHHLYSQILRKVTNYYWEQIWAIASSISRFMKFRPDCVASLKLIAVTGFYWGVRGKDKARSVGKKLSQFSPLSSLLLPHCSPMKISAVVMNHCCQWSSDDVCLIIWPNAIGIQILPRPLLLAPE